MLIFDRELFIKEMQERGVSNAIIEDHLVTWADEMHGTLAQPINIEFVRALTKRNFGKSLDYGFTDSTQLMSYKAEWLRELEEDEHTIYDNINFKR